MRPWARTDKRPCMIGRQTAPMPFGPWPRFISSGRFLNCPVKAWARNQGLGILTGKTRKDGPNFTCGTNVVASMGAMRALWNLKNLSLFTIRRIGSNRILTKNLKGHLNPWASKGGHPVLIWKQGTAISLLILKSEGSKWHHK